jgi:hypothetical protein
MAVLSPYSEKGGQIYTDFLKKEQFSEFYSEK